MGLADEKFEKTDLAGGLAQHLWGLWSRSPGEKAVRGAGSVTRPDLNLSGFEVLSLVHEFGFFQGCMLSAGGLLKMFS